MTEEMVDKLTFEIKDMLAEVSFDAKHLDQPDSREYCQKTIQHIYDVLTGSKII